MGLHTIIKKQRQKEKEMRFLMLGLDNAGKTTIIKKLLNEDISQISPTLGFNIKTLTSFEPYKLNIWDVGGQRTLRSYWRNYFERTDAVIWVVDATDRARMSDCRDELRGLLQEERLSGATLLVFANKADVEGCLSPGEIKDALGLEDVRTHTWKILRCSAVTGEGLEGGVRWVVEEVAKRIYMFG
ncbi:ARF/SAR superfamily [Saitoella complicata NRRL Y-17804]|uniref:ARF/SAR superfamily n=1 Tax=Saitoella complicata (strain BCRC 22490 / CBS 7301 / JCM 7358 / NBRC 10748 / NRRL Y-17804) TaxID=698492 RepID=UPI000866A45E|nr:ARF/SAR superfamily [Saitoella complicata NRRL Y-17804]ODQ54148.1 ARF/SAR superfamily [Saitoella complicata NRRL Y-17804]